jgi:hypothetical protein
MTDRIFSPRDDGFHFDQMSNDWWETETAWFSFHHPERQLGGWFYTMVRPNIGTVAGGAWVWTYRKKKSLFHPAPRLPAFAGIRPSRAVLAKAPGHSSSPPPLRAARRSAAEHGLDMPRRMGEGSASRVSSRQGLGTVRWRKRRGDHFGRSPFAAGFGSI